MRKEKSSVASTSSDRELRKKEKRKMSDTDETKSIVKKIKEENDAIDDDMNDDNVEPPPTLGPAALGLHRVGTALPPKPQSSQPKQVLNARGMPARIRKKNKLFFEDEFVNDHRALGGSSPKKNIKSSPSSSKSLTPIKILKKRRGVVSKYMKVKDEDENTQNSSSPIRASTPINATTRSTSTPISTSTQKLIIHADKKMGQQIGLRLRNLLKLPKAHKWVSFEWFYSYIDKPLFDEMNDFQICLNKSFPQLKTRMLTRKEWTKIRSMFGKPRRCSAAFFNEERCELERRRQKIRYLQNRKSADLNFVRDLPNEIPLPLPVGTKVTARLRRPQDGLFSGTVDAVDSLTSKYRIKFDRNGLGSHSIPDYEIVAIDFHETIPVSSLITDFRPRLGLNGNLLSSPLSRARNALNKSDPLLGQNLYQNQFKNPVLARETIGGYPVKLLELIVRIKKTLSIKHSKVERLKEMNNEAEMQKSYGDALSDDFQRRYANIVISLEKLNRDLSNYLNQLHSSTYDLTKESNIHAMLMPSYLREKCRQKAEEMVHRNNHSNINDEKILNLITNLATIMLVASNLSSSSKESNAYTLKVLDGCIEEVKQHLHPDNVEVFQKSVQIHLHHIQLGLGQMASKFNSNNSKNDISMENDHDNDDNDDS